MASKPSTVAFLVDQMADAGPVSAKKMFGDYGVFLDGKMIAIIGDDRLFFKPTAKGRALFTEVAEAVPYPGAKPCLLVAEEAWDDRDWLSALARATADELPVPGPKKKKSGKA